MQALDKKSVLFLRFYEGNGSKTWDVLWKRFKILKDLQKIISELETLKQNSSQWKKG